MNVAQRNRLGEVTYFLKIFESPHLLGEKYWVKYHAVLDDQEKFKLLKSCS